jgi:hypothetical protein
MSPSPTGLPMFGPAVGLIDANAPIKSKSPGPTRSVISLWLTLGPRLFIANCAADCAPATDTALSTPASPAASDNATRLARRDQL